MEINAVFEGGGVRGIAFAGAAAAALDARYTFHRTVGTSAGVLVGHRGIHQTRRIESVWTKMLLRKGVRFFNDLPERALEVVATDLTHGAGVSFPHCLAGHGVDPGSFPVARAVLVTGIRAMYSLPRTIEGADLVLDVPVRGGLDFTLTRRQATAVFTRARSAATSRLGAVRDTRWLDRSRNQNRRISQHD